MKDHLVTPSLCHLEDAARCSWHVILSSCHFILWALVALLWANLPYLVGYAASTRQNQFGGFFLYEQDGYSYYAKMRQGAQGAWEFHLPYTSEDEYRTGSFVYLFYLALGKFAPFGLSYSLLYHGARVVGSIILLLVLARFIARFVSDRRWQVWTWWLLLFSGGWGLLFSTFVTPKYVAYELIAPDAFIFSILYGTPHIILGFALLLTWIGYMLDTLKPGITRVTRRIVVANVLGFLTALSREAYGPAFAGIFLATLIALIIQRRTIPWREAAIVGLSCIGAGIYGVYLLFIFRANPGLAAWSRQNPFISPDPINFLLGFAPLLILAVAGLWLVRRHLLLITNYVFLTAWLIAGPIMAYLPIAVSRRLIIGWQIPLCIFAAYALLRLLDSRLPLRRSLAIGALVASALTTFLIIYGGTLLATARQAPLFQSADEIAALNWLGQHATDRDVVLSDWRFGNLVPIYSDARVFVGHPIETIGYTEKRTAVDRFFDPDASEIERRAILDRWRISLVVSGPASDLPFDPAHYTLAFEEGAYRVFRVEPK